jgi:hypothetical protein
MALFFLSDFIPLAFKRVNTKNKLVQCKGKSKGIPLQAWTGPQGSRRLRIPDFKTIGT